MVLYSSLLLVENYRPISLTSLIMKIFEKCITVLDKSYPMLVTNCLILDNMVLLMLSPVPRKWCHLRMTWH